MDQRDRPELFERIDSGVREGIAKAIVENKKIERELSQIKHRSTCEIGDVYCAYQVQFYTTKAEIQGSVQKFNTYQAAQDYIDQRKDKELPCPWIILKRMVNGECVFLGYQE